MIWFYMSLLLSLLGLWEFWRVLVHGAVSQSYCFVNFLGWRARWGFVMKEMWIDGVPWLLLTRKRRSSEWVMIWCLKARKNPPRPLLGNCSLAAPIIRGILRTIANLWKIVSGFEIQEIKEDIYLFIIKDDKEIERILSIEPWTFNKSFLLLKDVHDVNLGDIGELQFVHLWVQVHNFPSTSMIEKISTIIGDGIGICLKVDTDKDGRCIEPFIRVRVLINILKPKHRGTPVCLGSSGHKFGPFLNMNELRIIVSCVESLSCHDGVSYQFILGTFEFWGPPIWKVAYSNTPRKACTTTKCGFHERAFMTFV